MDDFEEVGDALFGNVDDFETKMVMLSSEEQKAFVEEIYKYMDMGENDE